MSNTAADGVTVTAMKSCIHKHPTHLDQRPLRPPKQNNAILVWYSFGSLRGLWSGGVRCLCIFSNDNICDSGQLRRPEIVLQKEQTSVINTDYCRRKKLSAMSLTPVNNLLPVLLAPAMTVFPGVVYLCQLHCRKEVSTTPGIRESCQY